MMKRVLVLMLVFTLSLVSVGVVAAGGGSELQALADGAVTLYAEPSETAEVVAELSGYSVMTLVKADETGAWLEVETDAGSGYVMVSDVLVMNLPLLAPKVYVATGQAGATGLYAAPAFSAEYLTALNDGAVASVLATSGEWAYVMTDAGTGWSVASAWAALPEGAYQAVVSLGSSPELGVFEEAVIGAGVVATVPDGNMVWVVSEVDAQWAEVMTADGTMGYALLTNLAPMSTLMVDGVAGSNSNPALFSEPNFGADVLGSLADGTSLTYIAAVDDFWVELYHPMYGMAYGLASNFGPVYTTATVQQPGSLVREGPNDTLYNVVASLDAGTTVIVKGVSETGAWVEVAVPFGAVDYGYNGVSGWMRDFLFVDDLSNSDLDASMLAVTE